MSRKRHTDTKRRMERAQTEICEHLQSNTAWMGTQICGSRVVKMEANMDFEKKTVEILFVTDKWDEENKCFLAVCFRAHDPIDFQLELQGGLLFAVKPISSSGGTNTVQ